MPLFMHSALPLISSRLFFFIFFSFFLYGFFPRLFSPSFMFFFIFFSRLFFQVFSRLIFWGFFNSFLFVTFFPAFCVRRWQCRRWRRWTREEVAQAPASSEGGVGRGRVGSMAVGRGGRGQVGGPGQDLLELLLRSTALGEVDELQSEELIVNLLPDPTLK